MTNRQLRNWVFMLYPDNPAHQKAIDYIDLLDNSLYIKHIAKYDEKGDIKNKEHYHCILRFDSPYWLSKVLSDLNLSEEDSHLFHSYKDFMSGKYQRFKSLNDYVDYLDHMLDPKKPDKYSLEDFRGGLVSWAKEVILSREFNKAEMLIKVNDFIRNYNLDHFVETRYFSMGDWLKVCNEAGYGDLFYKEWYKMRDLLSPYIYK